MNLGTDNIVPAALHRKVGWDMRHHFMAEKVVDRFGLQLPRDSELIRQLAVIYVLQGLRVPPAAIDDERTTVRRVSHKNRCTTFSRAWQGYSTL
jgi:hypothetical protein